MIPHLISLKNILIVLTHTILNIIFFIYFWQIKLTIKKIFKKIKP